MSEVYGNREIIINITNMILVFLSVILALTILGVAVRLKLKTRRMGWFIAALALVMGGLMAQVSAETMFSGNGLQKSDTYVARALLFYSLVAPIFGLYFIETEREEGQKWDGLFWTSMQGLISFLTVGEDECRAWTIQKGTKAPQAAGKIHTDFEKGFIRAEIVPYETLIAQGSMAACREKGLIRSEGKDYVMKDGDVTLFRFNV